MTTNEMIYEAITTDSRKRKARWQAELEALGYTIVKNGSWYISNPKTKKWIELEYDNSGILRTSTRNIRFGYMWSHSYKVRKNVPLSIINFEGILNSTRNKENNWCWTNVELMSQSLHDRKYHQNKLNNAMSEYQKTINNITKEYQKALKNAKDSYDWDIEYHTKGLEESNNTINKLLRKA